MTEHTREAVDAYLRAADRRPGEFLFAGRRAGRYMTTRQYARLVAGWIAGIGLNPCLYGTHSLRRTKATLIYRRTGNLRAIQLLLGHTKIESTVRYLGIEVDDALTIAEQVDVSSTRAERTCSARPAWAGSCPKGDLDDSGPGYPGPEPLIAPPSFESRRRKIREVRSFTGNSAHVYTR